MQVFLLEFLEWGAGQLAGHGTRGGGSDLHLAVLTPLDHPRQVAVTPQVLRLEVTVKKHKLLE